MGRKLQIVENPDLSAFKEAVKSQRAFIPLEDKAFDSNNFLDDTVCSYIADYVGDNFCPRASIVVGMKKDGSFCGEIWKMRYGMNYHGASEILASDKGLTLEEIIYFIENASRGLYQGGGWNSAREWFIKNFNLVPKPKNFYYYDCVDDELPLTEGFLNEDQTVKFNNQTYPKEGWCVILAGGPASGKSTARNTRIPIDGKVFDSDELKTFYKKLQNLNKIADEVEYDLSKPEDTTAIHNKIADKGWKKKREEVFTRNIRSSNKPIAPNVIFDITGDDTNKIIAVADKIKQLNAELGLNYKVSLIWIITDSQTALANNYRRKRTVHPDILLNIHGLVEDSVFGALFGRKGARYIDEAWLLFTNQAIARFEHFDTDLYNFLRNSPAIQLTKSGNRFEFPEIFKTGKDSYIDDFDNFLGDILGAIQDAKNVLTKPDAIEITFKDKPEFLLKANNLYQKELVGLIGDKRNDEAIALILQDMAQGNIKLTYTGPSHLRD